MTYHNRNDLFDRDFRRFSKVLSIFIVFVFLIVAIAIAVSLTMGIKGVRDGSVSWGPLGFTEMRCIDGYRFIISNRGESRQVLDEFGKAAKC